MNTRDYELAAEASLTRDRALALIAQAEAALDEAARTLAALESAAEGGS